MTFSSQPPYCVMLSSNLVYTPNKSKFFKHLRPSGMWSQWKHPEFILYNSIHNLLLTQNPIKCNNSLFLSFLIFTLLILLNVPLVWKVFLISALTSHTKPKASSFEIEDKVPKQVFIYSFHEAKVDKY